MHDIAKRVVSHADPKRITKEDLQSTLDSISVFSGCNFHRCWVAEYLPYWNKQLLPQIKKRIVSDKPLKFLQIGVFEGLSLIYLIKHIFAGYNCEVTIIDDFSTEKYFDTENTFYANTKEINPVVLKKDSHSALLELISSNTTFDFIYCSGSRKPAVCYVDFALLSKVVKPGSMLLLDTYYSWASYENEISPDIVRDTFIKAFTRSSDVAPIGRQLLMTFKEVKDDWVIKEKPADCVPR